MVSLDSSQIRTSEEELLVDGKVQGVAMEEGTSMEWKPPELWSLQ